jgi:hypothetical protein
VDCFSNGEHEGALRSGRRGAGTTAETLRRPGQFQQSGHGRADAVTGNPPDPFRGPGKPQQRRQGRGGTPPTGRTDGVLARVITELQSGGEHDTFAAQPTGAVKRVGLLLQYQVAHGRDPLKALMVPLESQSSVTSA